jgi:hypothetical protein
MKPSGYNVTFKKVLIITMKGTLKRKLTLKQCINIFATPLHILNSVSRFYHLAAPSPPVSLAYALMLKPWTSSTLPLLLHLYHLFFLVPAFIILSLLKGPQSEPYVTTFINNKL